MGKKFRNILTYVIFLGLGLLLLYLVYRKVDFAEMWAKMKQAKLWAIALSALMGYLAIVSRGVRWVTLIEPLGYKPNVWNSVHSVAFSYLSNTFIPRSGELARCGALNQTDGIPVDKLFGTVITERVVDFIMLFIYMAIALIGNSSQFMQLWDEASLSESMLFWMKIGIAGMAVGLVVLYFLRKKIAQTALFLKIKPFLLGLKDGVGAIMTMKRKWAFIGHTLFIWIMYFSMAYVMFLGIPGLEDTPLLTVLLVMIAGGWGMIFPSPGGVGSYHGATEVAFRVLGLGEKIGKVYAALVWFIQAFMIILTGGIGFIWITVVKLRRQREQIAALEND
ncbi:MAG: flippase-like domain-containing protein [Flavobacteriales bacterium]|nr:flippase-like domain-containing protein [Flavobacteriales bacterium]